MDSSPECWVGPVCCVSWIRVTCCHGVGYQAFITIAMKDVTCPGPRASLVVMVLAADWPAPWQRMKLIQGKPSPMLAAPWGTQVAPQGVMAPWLRNTMLENQPFISQKDPNWGNFPSRAISPKDIQIIFQLAEIVMVK